MDNFQLEAGSGSGSGSGSTSRKKLLWALLAAVVVGAAATATLLLSSSGSGSSGGGGGGGGGGSSGFPGPACPFCTDFPERTFFRTFDYGAGHISVPTPAALADPGSGDLEVQWGWGEGGEKPQQSHLQVRLGCAYPKKEGEEADSWDDFFWSQTVVVGVVPAEWKRVTIDRALWGQMFYDTKARRHCSYVRVLLMTCRDDRLEQCALGVASATTNYCCAGTASIFPDATKDPFFGVSAPFLPPQRDPNLRPRWGHIEAASDCAASDALASTIPFFGYCRGTGVTVTTPTAESTWKLDDIKSPGGTDTTTGALVQWTATPAFSAAFSHVRLMLDCGRKKDYSISADDQWSNIVWYDSAVAAGRPSSDSAVIFVANTAGGNSARFGIKESVRYLGCLWYRLRIVGCSGNKGSCEPTEDVGWDKGAEGLACPSARVTGLCGEENYGTSEPFRATPSSDPSSSSSSSSSSVGGGAWAPGSSQSGSPYGTDWGTGRTITNVLTGGGCALC